MRVFTGLVPPYFDGPVNFFRFFFSLFPKEIRFPVGKKKEAPQAPEKKNDAEALQAPRGKIYTFFFDFFFNFFFEK